MSPTIPRKLRLTAPAAVAADDADSVARVLLDRVGPVAAVLSDNAVGQFGFDHAAAAMRRDLDRDPRYLIGRLEQILSVLLGAAGPELPPLCALDELLQQAIGDAIEYRQSLPCRCEGGCDRCLPDWRQARLYEGLYGRLGLTADNPLPRPELKVAR